MRLYHVRFKLSCVRFRFSMAAYLPLSESRLLESKCCFKDFKFFQQVENGVSRVDFLENLAQGIPDLDYLLAVPPGVDPDSEDSAFKEKQKKRKKLSPSEMAKLPKEAKILIMSDGRKATAVANYLLDHYNRQMIKSESTQHNLCLFEAVLSQISNLKYIIGPDGETYNSFDLKLQTIFNLCVNYEKLFPIMEKHLTNSYKQYVINNLLTTSEVEVGMLAAIREVVQVILLYIVHF